MSIPLDLIDIDVDALSDEEAIALALELEEQEQLQRWQDEVASAFPWPDRSSWPYPHGPALEWRKAAAALLAEDPALARGARAYYRDNRCKEFINHWCITYDPRNATRTRPARLPFLLFPKQEEMIDYLFGLLDAEENGLIEKSRDMGATWLACSVSVYLWLYVRGAAIGWGSRKEILVDKLGDPDSIFEKIRMIILALPPCFWPDGFLPGDHMTYMKVINPENGATITGEAGDNIGRGGRKLIYFKDESAHYGHPELIEASLGDNTNVQVDFSSVNGLGNVFHRRRESGYDWRPSMDMRPGEVPVFVMDWRDHPGKTQQWYDVRRAKAEREGLLHKFKQEVDRDYAASVAGVIIPSEWVKAAIDADEVVGFDDSGGWVGALDVADGETEGADANAHAFRKGVVLKSTESWGARDTGETTRRFLGEAEGKGFIELEYDCIGVGSGVKAEANRLNDDGKLSPMIRLVPWNAGAGPINPDLPVIPNDPDSPLNKDHYKNLKAQAWWELRLRFERTYNAVKAVKAGEPNPYDPDELISIPSDLPQLRQIEKELSQPTFIKSPSMKLIVDKTPEGTRSPNIADAIVMAYHPVPGLKPIVGINPKQFVIPPMRVPGIFRRGYAIKVDGPRVSVLWAAYDRDTDVLYITAEHIAEHAEPVLTAQAIRARGAWIPGTFDCSDTNLKKADELQRLYHHSGLGSLAAAVRAPEAGVAELQGRVGTGRLKVFHTCNRFFEEYRAFRRDEDGQILSSGLMDCLRNLAQPEAIRRMIVEPSNSMLGPDPGNIYN